jgi:hypothetical protein
MASVCYSTSVQPAPAFAAPVVDEAKLKRAKVLRGCGGCGCAFAFLLAIGSGVLIGFGAQEATKEAMPFGIILGVVSSIMGFIFLIWLIIAIMKVKSARG